MSKYTDTLIKHDKRIGIIFFDDITEFMLFVFRNHNIKYLALLIGVSPGGLPTGNATSQFAENLLLHLRAAFFRDNAGFHVDIL